MKSRLKINGLILFLATLAVIMQPNLFLRTANRGDAGEAALKILGMAFILFGQLLRASGRGYKSEHSQNSRSLIRGGPYTLVRNPMYLGILLIGTGMLLMLFKFWVAAVFLLVFIMRYISLIFQEEKKLFALFPVDYPVYQKQAPRIFPAAASLFKNDIAEYLPLKLRWIKREVGSIVAVLLFSLLVEAYKDIKNIGLAEHLIVLVGILMVLIFFIGLSAYLIARTQQNVSGQS